MAKLTTLTNSWSLGLRSDLPMNEMPANSAIVMTNLIPNTKLAPLVKRAAWENAYTAHPDFTGTDASADQISSLLWAPFQGDEFLYSVSQNGTVFKLSPTGTLSKFGSDGALGAAPTIAPFWFEDRVIQCMPGGATQPWELYYDLATTTYTLQKITEPIPKATCGWAWGEYCVFANGGDPDNSYAIAPNTIWFCVPYVPPYYTGTELVYTGADDLFLTMPSAVLCGFAMTNCQIVFGQEECWIITGTTPGPSSVGGNLFARVLWNEGTVDARSACKWGEYIIWANGRSVWKTDGTQLVDLAARCGVKRAFIDSMESFDADWSAAGGCFANYYILTLANSGTESITWVFDLNLNVAWQFSGFPANQYAQFTGAYSSSVGQAQELFFGLSSASNIGRMQPVFEAGKAGWLDPTGDTIEWQLNTPYFSLGSTGEKRIRRAYVAYDYDNAGGGFIDVECSVSNTPFVGASGYQEPKFDLPPGVPSGRQPVGLWVKGRWISFQITNNGPVAAQEIILSHAAGAASYIEIAGKFDGQYVASNTFFISGSSAGVNDGDFTITSSSYDSTTDKTTVVFDAVVHSNPAVQGVAAPDNLTDAVNNFALYSIDVEGHFEEPTKSAAD